MMPRDITRTSPRKESLPIRGVKYSVFSGEDGRRHAQRGRKGPEKHLHPREKIKENNRMKLLQRGPERKKTGRLNSDSPQEEIVRGARLRGNGISGG